MAFIVPFCGAFISWLLRPMAGLAFSKIVRRVTGPEPKYRDLDRAPIKAFEFLFDGQTTFGRVTDPTITPYWWANIMSNARVFASASLHRLHKPCQFKRRENELYVKSPLYPATFSPVGSPLRKSFSSHWTPTSFHQADEPWAGRLHSKRSTKLAEISVQCVIDQVRLRTKVEEEEAE